MEVAKCVIRKFLDEIKAQVSDVNFDPTVVGDVSRLCRIPNTVNSKASKLLGRAQYAVPLSVEKFMSIVPDDYDTLCSSPRYAQELRMESHEALVMLTRITDDMDLDEAAITPKGSVKDPERLEAYARESTKEILADEDPSIDRVLEILDAS